MLKPILALSLVASMYTLFWFGQARGATGMLILAREEQSAIIADYEDALAHAQWEYDTMRNAANERIAQLEAQLEVEQDTREAWRQDSIQAKTERDRYRSLAAFRGGEAY